MNNIGRLLGFALVGLSALVASSAVLADRLAAASYYEEAAVYFKQGKHAEAIIELKNALQQDVGLLSARVLLGQVYMENDDVAAAEKELREAERLGADRSLTALLLAKAYLKQFKYQALLDELMLADYPMSVAGELLAYHGHAYLELLQFEEAEKAFVRAQQLAPKSPAPLAGLALMRLRGGDFDGAEAYVAKALALATTDTDSLSVRASVLHARGFLEKAIVAYGEVIKYDDSHMEARLARAGVYLDQQKYQQAEVDLAYVQEHYSFEPRAMYMQSMVHLRRGQQAAAKQALDKTAGTIEALDEGVLKRSNQLLMLAGLTYYSLGNYEQAQTYLNHLRSRAPGNLEVIKLLGAVLRAQNNYDELVRVLDPLVKNGVRDYKLLTMLGTAYTQKGRYGLASTLLEQAVEGAGEDLEPRLRQALNYFESGQQAKAVTLLAEVVAQDNSFTEAGTALAVMYIKLDRGDDAIKVLSPLLESQPENISLNNMFGSALVISKQYDEARKTFEKIEARAPDFMPIQINIARLDSLTARYDDARKRLKALLLTKDAPTLLLMFELAKVEEAAGNQEEAIRWAEKARSESRNAFEVRRYLVGLYQRADQPRQALDVALEIKLIAPKDLEVLNMVVSSYIALNDSRSAGSVLREMTTLAGFDYRWLYRIAKQQYTIRSYKEAEWSLQKAIKEAPDFIPANVALIEILTGLGKPDEAEQKLRDLLARVKKLDEAERLLGDIYLKRGDMKNAVQHFQIAQQQAPTEAVAIRLYQAYAFAGEWAKAVVVMQDWLATHPEDLKAKLALAEARLRQGEFEQAARVYEDVIQQTPDDSQVLGNLAFIYLKTGNANALSMAQKAHELAPEDAAINDTLGWILVKNGEAEKGLPYLREAHSRDSSNAEIRYHIAVALYELGRLDEAREELGRVLDSGRSFDGVAEAKALQRSIAK